MMNLFESDKLTAIRFGVLLVRTNRAGTQSFLTEARRAIWSVDANLPVFLVRTLEDVYDGSMARTSFTLVLLAIAGVMALVLGVVGIYGVISYAVTQRTREIGIRMALGAQPAGLQRMFVRQGLLLAAVGASVGLAAAAALTHWMASLLFRTTALDPLTYAAVAALLILAAALASYVPSRRASTVDPIEALRTE
jgi:ABC-type antimicrobial peptide transport system permease subunit